MTLATLASSGSQLCVVYNSYHQVRVLRRLPSPCHSHWTRTPLRHQDPRPTCSRHSVPLSLLLRRASLVMSTQTMPLCSALSLEPASSPSTHNAATADASTQLSIQEFLQLCFTKHPFRRTATLQLREDLNDAQCPSDSFAEFFERCILSKALPPRPSLPTKHMSFQQFQWR